MTDQLSIAERELLDMLLAGDDPVLNMIRKQAARWHVMKREWTGLGFYFDLGLPGEQPTSSHSAEWMIDDVGGVMGSAECEFQIFVGKDAKSALLECIQFGDVRVEAETQPSGLHYLWTKDPAVRELDYLRGKWASDTARGSRAEP